MLFQDSKKTNTQLTTHFISRLNNEIGGVYSIDFNRNIEHISLALFSFAFRQKIEKRANTKWSRLVTMDSLQCGLLLMNSDCTLNCFL